MLKATYMFNSTKKFRQYTKNRLQKVQDATTGFVCNKYAKMKDVLESKLLTTEEGIKLSTLIFLFKALHDQQFQ